MASQRRQASRDSKRVPLTRERIFAAALDIIDRESLSGLTMRRVASELAVDPMALYYHLDDRAALLDGVVALVIQQFPGFEDLAGPWEAQVQDAARRFRSTLLAHAQAVPIIATQPASTRFLADLAESALAFLLALDIEIEPATDLLWLVNAYVIGHVLSQVPEPGEDVDGLGQETARFDRGLRTILVGFAITEDLPLSTADAGPVPSPTRDALTESG